MFFVYMSAYVTVNTREMKPLLHDSKILDRTEQMTDKKKSHKHALIFF